ncbi:MAG: GDP-mannose 4,6-dehydratase, partial [Candidatus Lokiarchaeota archaeon]|nr:GDP-mannose 4,6-dehydratase [Candidatus Lokiarchaeota archaeon]
IYGTRQFGVEDQGWVAHFIISAILGKKIKIFGDGKQVRDVLYVADLVNAFDSYIKKADQIKHNVFCMGGGPDNTISLLELIALLEKLLGNKEIEYEFQDWRPSDQKVYISDIRKVKSLLKWVPKINPEEGVKKIFEWVKKNKNLFA